MTSRRLAMSLFVDYVNASGNGKLQIISRSIGGSGWDPYLPARQAIVAICEGRKTPRAALDEILKHASTRGRACAELVASFVDWYDPNVPARRCSIRGHWIGGDLAVPARPDLTLANGDDETLLRLHLRQDPLGTSRAETTLHLMARAFESHLDRGGSVAVLDLRQGALFERRRRADSRQEVLLQGEAAAYLTMRTMMAA